MPFEEFVTRYFSFIFYLARRRTRGDAEAEDLVQDVLVKIYEKRLLSKFKGKTEGEFKSYVAGITIHTIYDHHRKTRSDRERLVAFSADDGQQLGALGFSASAESEFERRELEARVHTAIDKLPEDYAQVINLKLLGYTQPEIAEVLNAPLGTIASWTARALDILKKNCADLQVKP